MREYRVWKKEEEQALRLGVAKHGSGAWELIRTDPEFSATLQARSGVQLKDKWRNLVKFNHLTPEELNCGAGGGVKTRTGLRQRTRRVHAESAGEDEETTTATTKKSRAKTACRSTDAFTPSSTKEEHEVLKIAIHLRNVATSRAESCADTDTNLTGSTVQFLDYIINAATKAIEDEKRLLIPAAIVRAAPPALQVHLEAYSDSPNASMTPSAFHGASTVDNNTSSPHQAVVSSSRGGPESSGRNSGAPTHMGGSRAPGIITTGANPRARKDAAGMHEGDGLRDLYACMDYQFTAAPAQDRRLPVHSMAPSIGVKRSLGDATVSSVPAPPQKKMVMTGGESTGATGTCIDANVTDSADDGPLISYNAPFNPHASIMNNADLLLNVASNHSDGACTRLHPEGEDSASLSEAGDDDNADDDFLRKLYKDCFDSKPHYQEHCVDHMLQLDSAYPMSYHHNAPATFRSVAPTRLSAPQLHIDDVNLHNIHESPMSQSTQGPQTSHPGSWTPHSAPPMHPALASAQCMMKVNVPRKVASNTSTPAEPSQHRPLVSAAPAATDCPKINQEKSEHVPGSASFRDSPSSCTVSTSGGSTLFKAPFPWGSNAQPNPPRLVSAPPHTNAATSSLMQMHGISPSASFHSMYSSHDAVAKTPFRICSRESSVKAGAESPLPEVSRSFQNTTTSDISPTSEPMPEHWSDVASHAVLNSTASVLLGFPPARDMQAVASLSGLPTSMAAHIPTNISFQPHAAFSSDMDTMHLPHAFSPCGSNKDSGMSTANLPPCSGVAASEPAQDPPSSDPLAYFSHLSATPGSMPGYPACDKLGNCDVPPGVFNPSESCAELETLMDMEGATADLVFDGFKNW